MAGRGRMSRRAIDDGRRRYPEIPPEGPFIHGHVRRVPHPAILEEELELRDFEIRRLVSDNRRLVDDRIALQRELAAVKEKLHRMSMTITDIRAEKDAHSRDLIERNLKLEADLRANEPLRNETIQLRSEIPKLNVLRQDLSSQVQGLTQELARSKVDNKQIPALKSEIDGLHEELMHSRNAIDYEKKGNFELLEQRQAMEKNLVSMAREVEKLRADLGRFEGHTWASGGPYGIPEEPFPSSYADAYRPPTGAVADNASSFTMGSGSWGGYDKSHFGHR